MLNDDNAMHRTITSIHPSNTYLNRKSAKELSKQPSRNTTHVINCDLVTQTQKAVLLKPFPPAPKSSTQDE